MRTDVKVGLVCVLALVIAVIGYFALQGKSKDTSPNSSSNTSLTSATPAGSTGAGGSSGSTGSTGSPSLADPGIATPPTLAPPADSSPAVSPPATLAPPATPDMDAPPVAFTHQPGLGQTPSVYSPPSSPTTAPAGGSTLYPPGGEPRATLLPPLTTGGSTTAPGTVGRTGSGAPSMGGSTHTTRGTASHSTEVEPGARPRDSLLEPGTPPRVSSTLVPPGDVRTGPAAVSDGTTYAVQNGDNLTVIAKKNHTTLAALKAANPTINPDRLKINQVIHLPAPGSTPPVAATTRPAVTPRSSTRPATVGRRVSTTRPAAVAGSSYRVKKGDTLRKIAKAVYGDEKLWRRIFRVNRGELSNANDIEPGMVLKIPAR